MSKLSNGVKIPPKLPHNPLIFFFSHSLETLAVKPHNDRHWRGLIWLDGCSRYSVSWCIMVYHDVSCTEDMSRYAQYLQQPARHRNKGDGWRRMETGSVWSIAALPAQHTAQHSILLTALHCQWTVIVRYLEPVIAVLSRIWAEMDSMREHRLLRFKLLRPQNMKERIVLIIIVHTFRNYPMIMNWFHDRDLISHDSIHFYFSFPIYFRKNLRYNIKAKIIPLVPLHKKAPTNCLIPLYSHIQRPRRGRKCCLFPPHYWQQTELERHACS